MTHENYFILVSEPWDFESLDGKNIIKGEIVDFNSSKYLVFKSNYLLRFGDIEGFFLILTPRLEKDDFYNIKNEVFVNGAILLFDFKIKCDENELLENSKFVLMGSVKKDQV